MLEMRWFIWHDAVSLQLAQALCTIVSHAWWFGRGSLQIVSYLYRVRHCSGSSSLFCEFVIVPTGFVMIRTMFDSVHSMFAEVCTGFVLNV